MMDYPIYLDYAATTPCDPRVVEHMLPFFGERYGNPASRYHRYGWEAEEAVENARMEIARLIGAKPGEICFTGGATESANLAIRGVMKGGLKGKHIITVATEHKCVLETVYDMEREGFDITCLGVSSQGQLLPGHLEAAFRPDTALVCVMYANNETGVVLPVTEIASQAHRHGALFFCDATQAVGKTAVDVHVADADLMAFTAHKIYGPKGTGALFVRGGIQQQRVSPLITGGSHEGGLRGGTLNVPAVAGFGVAARLCREHTEQEVVRIREQQKAMEDALMAIPGVILNGDTQMRLPHITNLSIEGIDSERLLYYLSSRVALGSGSACSSITREPSHVLQAMGVTGSLLNGSIRISRGRFTSQEEHECATRELIMAIQKLRDQPDN